MLLLALSLVSASPLDVNATVEVLDNGLTVIYEEDHRTDVVALHIHYGVGGRDERPGEYGAAHLFEHVMFEGSRNVPQNMFDQWLTGAGGSNNAYTSEDETAYHETFPSGALDVALFLESDRMGFLLEGLTQDNLDNQRGVVLQERAEGHAEPGGRNWDAFTRLSWHPEHPYHHPVIGTVADVEGFELDPTIDFWQRHYRPQNAILVLTGNFDTAAAQERVHYWFQDVPDVGPADERAGVSELPLSTANGYITDAVDARSMMVGWNTVPLGHEDEPAIDLLGYILSNGRGTALEDGLYYKKSWTYDVGAFSTMSEIGGQFIFYAETDRDLNQVLGRAEKIIAKAAKKPPTADQLDRARRAMRSSILNSLETPEDRAGRLASCYRIYGQADCLVDDWARYDAVTPADIQRVAQQYLQPERRITLSIVPEGDEAGVLEGAELVEIP